MTRPVWTYPPDWKQSIIERLMWSTAVSTSLDGTEERRRVRRNPRRALTFQTTIDGAEMRALDAQLWAHQPDEWLMPLWWDVALSTTKAVPAGGNVINVPTADRDFRADADAWIVLLDLRTGEYHASTVSAVDPTSIDFDTPTTKSWPIGTRVYPARIVRLDASQQVGRTTAGVVDLQVHAEVVDVDALQVGFDPNADGVSRTYGAPATPVFDLRPDRSEPINADYRRLLERIDFQVGNWSVVDRGGRAFVASTHSHKLLDRASRWAYRRWLEHLAGRNGECWCPTWQADLELVADLGAADNTIDVEAVGYAQRYAQQIGREHLCIRLKDGSLILRKIIGSADNGDGTETLITDDSEPAAIARADVAQISWLERVRGAADAVELRHQSAAVTETSITLRTLR